MWGLSGISLPMRGLSFLTLCFLLVGCSLSSSSITISSARIAEDVDLAMIPRNWRGLDSRKQDVFVVMEMNGSSLKRIIQSGVDPSLAYVDCASGNSESMSFGPFFQGDFVGPSLRTDQLKDGETYRVYGTIPRSYVLRDQQVCAEIIGSDASGASIRSNRIRLTGIGLR